MKTALLLATAALLLVACTRSQARDPDAKAPKAATTASASPAASTVLASAPPVGERLSRTEDEWKQQLSAEEFYVLRKHGTERAFTGKYWNHKGEGVYTCAACGAPLFDSQTKFKSGTGWPSFYTPVQAGRVSEHSDDTLGMSRVEVRCSRCNGHLGHVFRDGPQPTGLRYCINSAALDFAPAEGAVQVTPAGK